MNIKKIILAFAASAMLAGGRSEERRVGKYFVGYGPGERYH